MERLHRRKLYQKVSSNIQRIDGNNNNQAGRDIVHNNFLPYLGVKPKSIRVKAIRNYTLFYLILSLSVSVFFIFVFSVVLYATKKTLLEDGSTLFMVIVAISAMLGAFLSITFLEKLLNKVSWGHVLYRNGTIIYKLKRERFYDDIWDMQLEKKWGGQGKLQYFGINKISNIPYMRSIVVLKYAEAKYIYDSFWSHKRIREFENAMD